MDDSLHQRLTALRRKYSEENLAKLKRAEAREAARPRLLANGGRITGVEVKDGLIVGSSAAGGRGRGSGSTSASRGVKSVPTTAVTTVSAGLVEEGRGRYVDPRKLNAGSGSTRAQGKGNEEVEVEWENVKDGVKEQVREVADEEKEVESIESRREDDGAHDGGGMEEVQETEAASGVNGEEFGASEESGFDVNEIAELEELAELGDSEVLQELGENFDEMDYVLDYNPEDEIPAWLQPSYIEDPEDDAIATESYMPSLATPKGSVSWNNFIASPLPAQTETKIPEESISTAASPPQGEILIAPSIEAPAVDVTLSPPLAADITLSPSLAPLSLSSQELPTTISSIESQSEEASTPRQKQETDEDLMEQRFLALASGLRIHRPGGSYDDNSNGSDGGGEDVGGGSGSGGIGEGGENAIGLLRGAPTPSLTNPHDDELRERFKRVFEGRYIARSSTGGVIGGSDGVGAVFGGEEDEWLRSAAAGEREEEMDLSDLMESLMSSHSAVGGKDGITGGGVNLDGFDFTGDSGLDEELIAQWIGFGKNAGWNMSKAEEDEIEKLLAEANFVLPPPLEELPDADGKQQRLRLEVSEGEEGEGRVKEIPKELLDELDCGGEYLSLGRTERGLKADREREEGGKEITEEEVERVLKGYMQKLEDEKREKEIQVGSSSSSTTRGEAKEDVESNKEGDHEDKEVVIAEPVEPVQEKDEEPEQGEMDSDISGDQTESGGDIIQKIKDELALERAQDVSTDNKPVHHTVDLVGKEEGRLKNLFGDSLETEDDILQKIKAELSLERAQGISNTPPPPYDSATSSTHPNHPVRDSSSLDSDSGDDPALTSLRTRLTSLSIHQLPDLPTSHQFPSIPTTTFPSSSSSLAKKMTQEEFKRYREEQEADHWCCICNEDAEFKCSGCEGDLYCEKCLWEGHTGPNAGVEERRHRWTRYVRPKREGQEEGLVGVGM